MKKLTLIGTVVTGLMAISGLQAAEVSLEGKAVCAKCNLKSAAKCATVLQVTEGEETKNYYLKGKLARKIKGKSGTVKGELKEVDGKMVVVASDVQVKK